MVAEGPKNRGHATVPKFGYSEGTNTIQYGMPRQDAPWAIFRLLPGRNTKVVRV